MLEERGEPFPYRYLLVYSMSSRAIGETRELMPKLNWDEVVEFRCFDPNGELHGFPYADGVCTVEITERNTDRAIQNQMDKDMQDSIIQNYSLNNLFGGSPKDTLSIKRSIRYDEDGQGCIISSRCYEFTKGGH